MCTHTYIFVYVHIQICVISSKKNDNLSRYLKYVHTHIFLYVYTSKYVSYLPKKTISPLDMCTRINIYVCVYIWDVQTRCRFCQHEKIHLLSRHTSSLDIPQSVIQPIPLGVTFSKAQSSKLERLFCHVSVKKDVRALSFELWNSILKYHPKLEWLYPLVRRCIHRCIFSWCISSIHRHIRSCITKCHKKMYT